MAVCFHAMHPSLPLPRSASKAAATAYVEVLAWTLLSSARLCQGPAGAAPPAATSSAPEPQAYCAGLLQGTLCTHVLPVATGAASKQGLGAEGALGLVSELLQQMATTLASKASSR